MHTSVPGRLVKSTSHDTARLFVLSDYSSSVLAGKTISNAFDQIFKDTFEQICKDGLPLRSPQLLSGQSNLHAKFSLLIATSMTRSEGISYAIEVCPLQ